MATILKLAIKNIYPNYQHYTDIDPSGGFMVFNTIFNDISAISWQSVLLVEELEVL